MGTPVGCLDWVCNTLLGPEETGRVGAAALVGWWPRFPPLGVGWHGFVGFLCSRTGSLSHRIGVSALLWGRRSAPSGVGFGGLVVGGVGLLVVV